MRRDACGPHKRSRESMDDKDDDGCNVVGEGVATSSLSDAIQFALFPCMKNRQLFAAPAEMLTDGTVQTVVSVESLYKVFERC